MTMLQIRHTIFRVTPLILLCSLLLACAPQKKLLKEAELLNSGGLTRQAYSKYESIYQTYRSPEALMAMRRIAQEELSGKLNDATQQCMRGDYHNALLSYESAFAYQREKEFLEKYEGAWIKIFY